VDIPVHCPDHGPGAQRKSRDFVWGQTAEPLHRGSGDSPWLFSPGGGRQEPGSIGGRFIEAETTPGGDPGPWEDAEPRPDDKRTDLWGQVDRPDLASVSETTADRLAIGELVTPLSCLGGSTFGPLQPLNLSGNPRRRAACPVLPTSGVLFRCVRCQCVEMQ